ncbi:serine/threonine protein kinase [Xylanimonas allomyrinae]|uniref:non-specific serine/threonine protein kinase n=1 Tax=Xylanimonas allomyrinae TaxID=2509459 RepID=A0A4P6ER90_9MICO|nr:serine/threonine-protein kinase [Xylanimonas allomyrinae]QAY64009.1 serine/threonine protein kinase [Xylanimonas allomyrinae]
MRPATGIALGERYRLARRLAVGGMGEVWVADDTFLGREVAVKVLREEYTGHEDFLRRLRTEARNSAALSHPNIAQMYDYGEQEGTGYLVMELVLGEPLADLLEREPVLPPKRLLPILAQTARGLHAAHEAGVVHRDVKPGNILLERPARAAEGPTVKITDFGVSLAANQAAMTATGMVMGTAQYLSPEQAVGQPATPLSDVYALGVVAYEATAGKRPFTGNTPVDIAVAHVNNPVPPLPATVHPGLVSLVTRLLEKDPARRPASAGTLAEEFDDLAREIAADPLGARSRTARRLRGAARTTEPSATGSAAVSTSTPESAAGSVPATNDPVAVPAGSASSAHVEADRTHAADAHPAPETLGRARGAHAAPLRPAAPTPRPLPLRRDLHGPRPTGRSEEAARTVDALRRDLARRRPADPAAAHRLASRSARDEDGAGSTTPRTERTSTTTGLRLGPLGKLSWPLVGLLVLLLVLVLATLVSSLTDANDTGAHASGPRSPISMTSVAARPDGSGMMLRNASHGEAAATTTPKDV